MEVIRLRAFLFHIKVLSIQIPIYAYKLKATLSLILLNYLDTEGLLELNTKSWLLTRNEVQNYLDNKVKTDRILS